MELDLNKLEQTPHLLDMLLEIEDVLDSLDIYVFRNWMRGAVVNGPVIRRYWVEITLRYLAKDMPDPRAGLRLLKHGILVKFSKDVLPKSANNDPIWYVTITVPRKLIKGMGDASTDFYDEEVDATDVEGAIDLGVDDETGTVQRND
jgi:hypothetical protein